MCSSPKMPKAPAALPPAPPPPQAPSAPPPPTKTATKVGNKALKNRNSSSRKRGTSALTVRRSTVNTGSSGSGANINY